MNATIRRSSASPLWAQHGRWGEGGEGRGERRGTHMRGGAGAGAGMSSQSVDASLPATAPQALAHRPARPAAVRCLGAPARHAVSCEPSARRGNSWLLPRLMRAIEPCRICDTEKTFLRPNYLPTMCLTLPNAAVILCLMDRTEIASRGNTGSQHCSSHRGNSSDRLPQGKTGAIAQASARKRTGTPDALTTRRKIHSGA